MSIKYSTNWMGPLNLNWIKEHGDNWASGRVDVYGDRHESEIGLPPMDNKDWHRFSHWLDDITTDRIYNLEELVKWYEKTNPKIIWLRTPEWEKYV